MAQTTVRISESARDRLRSIAKIQGKPMQVILERAIEVYRRQTFLEQVNAGYAALRQDEPAWQEMVAEHALWDNALADGLPPEDPAGESGRHSQRRQRRP